MTDNDRHATDTRRRWPTWRIALAYLVLGLLALASIVYIDRGVMRSLGELRSAQQGSGGND